MPTSPDSPRRRSWLVPQFSLGTLMWLMLFAGMALVWWKDRSSLDQRIQKLEQMYSPTRPALWSAADILGAPDDPTGTAGKSWCPTRASSLDWVEVGFDNPVAAATIDILLHASPQTRRLVWQPERGNSGLQCHAGKCNKRHTAV